MKYLKFLLQILLLAAVVFFVDYIRHGNTLTSVDTHSSQEKYSFFQDNFEKTSDCPPAYKVLNTQKTYNQFRKALKNTRTAILIESPWLGRAIEQILPDIETLLRQQKYVVLIYGNPGNSKSRKSTPSYYSQPWQTYLSQLRERYFDHFKVVNLREHLFYLSDFEKRNAATLVGTHRKLLIKDNDYFITGSFNFLSFNYQWLKRKSGAKKLSLEESVLIKENVLKKWQEVREQYQLEILDEIIEELEYGDSF